MKKISASCYSLLTLLPATSWAKINTMYDAKEKLRQMQESVQNSHAPEVFFATAGAIGAFVALIVIVFVLIMLLKR